MNNMTINEKFKNYHDIYGLNIKAKIRIQLVSST